MKKYQIIYADPPWKYYVNDKDNQGQGRAEKHYPTMSVEDICSLPINELAEKDCKLFLWATPPVSSRGYPSYESMGI